MADTRGWHLPPEASRSVCPDLLRAGRAAGTVVCCHRGGTPSLEVQGGGGWLWLGTFGCQQDAQPDHQLGGSTMKEPQLLHWVAVKCCDGGAVFMWSRRYFPGKCNTQGTRQTAPWKKSLTLPPLLCALTSFMGGSRHSKPSTKQCRAQGGLEEANQPWPDCKDQASLVLPPSSENEQQTQSRTSVKANCSGV